MESCLLQAFEKGSLHFKWKRKMLSGTVTYFSLRALPKKWMAKYFIVFDWKVFLSGFAMLFPRIYWMACFPNYFSTYIKDFVSWWSILLKVIFRMNVGILSQYFSSFSSQFQLMLVVDEMMENTPVLSLRVSGVSVFRAQLYCDRAVPWQMAMVTLINGLVNFSSWSSHL